MKKFFGTDGIRGLANKHPITQDFIQKLAYSLGKYIKKNSKQSCKVLIGKDTRISCDMIEASLVSSFLSIGIDCIIFEPTPTSIISFMTKKLKCNLGIMISASHNPFYDNGIKVFKNNGEKLSDKDELKIEKMIERFVLPELVEKKQIGRIIKYNSDFKEYKNSIKRVFPKTMDFSNLKIILDCANGAAYKIAPEIFQYFNINFKTIFNKPNGKNINKNCGSLFLNNLKKEVLKENANLGFAFDGDADRLIVIDSKGKVIDGDKILAIIGTSLLKLGKLKGGGIVTTKMSNLGLKNFLLRKNIKLYQCNVGDRYVVKKMKEKKCNLGGEQSGHIIFKDISESGDAILSALQILLIIKLENKTIDEILDGYKSVPQKLLNFELKDLDILKNTKFISNMEKIKNKIKRKGSLLIRKSGTENKLRVMVQTYQKSSLNKIISDITKVINEI
tara:strand:+ start:198 stop:1538 length:1341 start_codon:yes stop_codon:yes gene_type:complete